MKTQITLDDTITPYLKALEVRGGGFINQALNKGGSKVRSMIEKSVNASSQQSPWNQEFRDHRRLITLNKKPKKAWDRLDKGTGRNTRVSLGKFTRFRLYPDKHVVLAGFIDTPTFTTYRYEGGVKHKLGRKSGVYSRDIALLEYKGGRVALTPKQRKLFEASGFKKIAKRGYVTRKAHYIKNFNAYKSIMIQVAKKEFGRGVKEWKLKENL